MSLDTAKRERQRISPCAPALHACRKQGGVTPSIGDIEGALLAVEGSRTKVHVLIRPRPGDFVYSALEKQVPWTIATTPSLRRQPATHHSKLEYYDTAVVRCCLWYRVGLLTDVDEPTRFRPAR